MGLHTFIGQYPSFILKYIATYNTKKVICDHKKGMCVCTSLYTIANYD